jgi:hypothetical protein
MIGARPAKSRLATTRLFMSIEDTTAHDADGLFMNEEGNVFSACMTCEGRNEPFPL